MIAEPSIAAATSKRHSIKWLWLTLFVTLAIVIVLQLPLFLNPDFIDEDLRFFYWLHRFTDHSLFADDPLLGYQFAELNIGANTLLFNKVSLLYGALYALVSPFISPFLFSKLLIIPLALISSYYLFRIGEPLTANPFTAFLLCITFILIVTGAYSEVSLANGLPRAFTLPLLLAMIFYMINKNDLGMAIVLFISVLYPPTFLTVLLAYAVKFAWESFRQRRLAISKKQLLYFGIAFFLATMLLLPAVFTGLNTVPGDPETTTATTVFTSPIFGDNGRYPLLQPSILAGNGGLLDNGLIGLYSLFCSIFLIPIFLVLRNKFIGLPASFWHLAFASIFGFVLSWLAILMTPSATFHMPSRYTRGTIFLIVLILLMLNGPLAMKELSHALQINRQNKVWLVVGIGLLGFIIIYWSDLSLTLTLLIGLLLLLLIVLSIIYCRRSNSKTTPTVAPAEHKPSLPETNRNPLPVQTIFVTLLLLLPLPFMFNIQNSGKHYHPPLETVELIEFLETLPMDTRIAGYPCFLNDIPLYAQRTVLFSCEIESRDMVLMEETLSAYFAETGTDVLSFCQKYNVDYIVAGNGTFTKDFQDRELILFEPLNSYLKEMLQSRNSFVLEQLPEQAILFQNQTYFVFPCQIETFTAAGPANSNVSGVD